MITCSVCGHLNDPSRVTCEECGSDLSDSPDLIDYDEFDDDRDDFMIFDDEDVDDEVNFDESEELGYMDDDYFD